MTNGAAADAESPAAFVEAALHDPANPVVMFALEWCEFCGAVRKLFARYGIPYRSVDIDSVAYQDGGRGLAIRAALTAKTSIPTIPQVFIGGKLIGGSSDVVAAWRPASSSRSSTRPASCTAPSTASTWRR